VLRKSKIIGSKGEKKRKKKEAIDIVVVLDLSRECSVALTHIVKLVIS